MIHSLLWQRLDLPGHEFCKLEAVDKGWLLAGTAVFAHEERPCTLDYRIRCSSDWRTESAEIRGWIGSKGVTLHVSVSRDRSWRLNDVDCPAVAGCIDIDLGFSPSTNLLPIRRLALGIRESAAVQAAWLPFPALSLEPLAQTYRRLGETTYHYESAGGAFERTLEVNETGFVTSYPGLWQIESAAAASASR